MEQIMGVIVLALIGAVAGVFMNESKLPVLGVMVVLATGAIIFLKVLPQLAEVIRIFAQLADYAALNQGYLFTVFKVLGIAYVSEFAAQICRDAGQNALAAKIEMAAKIGVMALAVPIMMSVLESIIQILN
ncbi:MAG: stage III sporulation protein AD [Peptococcaceae bacterium]|jgi:stage III sporulation protein AD|nr:stage III sporulation protein AD [Peptococcaceae bacterium]